VKPFPMPNEELAGRTVIASVEYFADERGEVALVLLLEKEKPFFTVAHYALTPIAESEANVGMAEGEYDVLGRFENIVPAIREYEQNGGDW
jgi:hypothetical protein